MKLRSLTVRGFRVFGITAQTMTCDGPLAVVHGANSQGKTSLVEAFEFLLTGYTSRARMHSSKTEFTGCLRNVHLPKNEEVFVEGVFEIAGVVRTIRRVLVADIDQSGACSSILTVDGAPADDVSAYGISLASPPLESPVLMQHTLRYVLAAGPQDRTDYLKALLDIADLDDMRRVITAEIDAITKSPCPSLAKWETAKKVPELKSVLEQANLRSSSSLEHALSEAIAILAGPQPTADFAVAASAFETELKRRRTGVFPSDAFVVIPDPVIEWPSFGAVDEFARATSASALAPPAVLEVLQAVIRLPHLPSEGEPIDCPVCLTSNALTLARIETIRTFIDARESERTVLERIKAEMLATKAAGRRVREYLTSRRPQALSWSEPERDQYALAARALLGDEAEGLLAGLLRDAGALAPPWDAATRALDEASAAVKQTQTAIDAGSAVNVAALRNAVNAVDDAMNTLRACVEAFSAGTADALARVKTAVATRSDTAGWDQVVELCACYATIPAEIEERHRFERFRKNATTALKQIERARGAVLDANFESLSEEVSAWWNLLRPNEPVRFSGVKRRGAGLRYVDIKALLSSTGDEDGVERDAAGVFSDSQLNALGLAVFLARAAHEEVGLVVMDDPVPASDLEHRASFSQSVLGKLIADGAVQAIVTTHDRDLNRRIHDLHGHAAIDGYDVTTSNSGEATLIRRRDDLWSLFTEAESAVKYCPDSQLGETSNTVRKLAERLMKDVIVTSRRKHGVEVSIADLDEALGELIPKATPFLTTDPSHPGKARHAATVLNPGSHDDPRVPVRQDLVSVMGDLKTLRNTYCQRRSVSSA